MGCCAAKSSNRSIDGGNNLNQIAVIGYKTGTIDILKYKRNCSELEKNVQLILNNVTEPTRMEK